MTATYAQLTESKEDFTGLLTADLGGYRLRNFREAGGEETLRFEATLTKDGKDVMTVSNDGNGGMHRYSDERSDAYRDLLDFAKSWEQESDYPFGGAPSDPDSFINHLTNCAAINRGRSVAIIFDDLNPFDYRDGRHATMKVPYRERDKVVSHLAARADASGKNYRVWSKETWKFEPVS